MALATSLNDINTMQDGDTIMVRNHEWTFGVQPASKLVYLTRVAGDARVHIRAADGRCLFPRIELLYRLQQSYYEIN